ncbi:MAG: hypothetical protein ABSF25_22255 [Bryobacteraceae bacterium]|jgi:hypothetical protein
MTPRGIRTPGNGEIGRLLLEEFLQAEAILARARAADRMAAEERYADTWRRIGEYVVSGTIPRKPAGSEAHPPYTEALGLPAA